MHKVEMVYAACILLSACSKHIPVINGEKAVNKQKTTSSYSQSADPCPNQISTQVQGWIKVFLPGKLNFPAKRSAIVKIAKGDIGNPDNDKEKDQKDHEPNSTGAHKNTADPFHLYIRSAGFTSDKDYPYVAVRVITPAASEFNFGRLPDVNASGIASVSTPFTMGSGIIGLKPSHVICTSSDYSPTTTKNGRKVATFFVNAANVPTSPDGDDEIAAPSYNIIIAPAGAAQTPIIIDPKVYNDG